MKIEEIKFPFYAKATIFIIGIIGLLAILYIAQSIIVPLVFAIIMAVLLSPIVDFLVQKRINRLIAIIIALFLTFIVIAGFGVLLFSQASRFTDSWPDLVEKFTDIFNDAIIWASGYLDIDAKNIHEWITKTQGEIINQSTAAIGQTLVTIGTGVMIALLLPLYIFLILYYQPLLRDFIHQLFRAAHQSQVSEIVSQIKNVIQRYLVGLIIETAIVAGMQITTLFVLGIEYAILLGIIGALLNLIPYIGGLVAVLIPMIVALATKTSAYYAIYVLVIYYIIQLIDNNFIVPYIVASKVKINALFSIIVVFVGNALWGIPGMFLSIPLLAIVKLIFDHVETMKPWGFLLGDTMPSIMKIEPILKKIIKIS